MAWQPFGPLQAVGDGNGLSLWETVDQERRRERRLGVGVVGVRIVGVRVRASGYRCARAPTH